MIMMMIIFLMPNFCGVDEEKYSVDDDSDDNDNVNQNDGFDRMSVCSMLLNLNNVPQ